jgi:hypothetical protein
MNTEIKQNEFKCAMCGGVFEKKRSEEELNQEYMDNFGPVIATHDEGSIVCDDCYNEFHPRLYPEKVQATKEVIISNMPHN